MRPRPLIGGSFAMWIGMIVLCTFVFAAIASLALAIRSGFKGQWHMTVAFLLPALGLGGPIAFLAGPAAWIWLFGNPDLRVLPKAATQLAAADITKLVSDHSVAGMYYDTSGGVWLHFQEQYRADGGLTGTGGPDDNPTKISWTGSWRLDGDKMCWRYEQEETCRAVYADGDRYDAVNDRNEVDTWFKPSAPSN
jgi:hypothetical protein